MSIIDKDPHHSSKTFPLHYLNGNTCFTNFKSETYDYRFKGISLGTGSPKGNSFGLIVSRYYHSKDEVADLALDLDDAIALRDALNLYIKSEGCKSNIVV